MKQNHIVGTTNLTKNLNMCDRDGSVEVQTTQRLREEDRDENCGIWGRRILKTARISVLTQDFRDHKEWKPKKYSTAISEKNVDKNRYKSILCADENRVILKDRSPSNDYIHASWMIMPDKTKFISTQGPLKSTTNDFWHMVFTEKCNVIVMLCGVVEDGTEKCTKYFIKDGEKDFGDYQLKVIEKTTEPFNPVKYTVIQVRKKDSKEKHIVHHYWYYDWHDQIAPIDPIPITKLYNTARSKAENSPMVVHCSAGVGRTSTFVGIHLGLEMIKEDSTVELSDILKELRRMRLGSIQSQLQYIFLLVCILQLLIDRKILKKDSIDHILKKYADITKKVAALITDEEEKKKVPLAKKCQTNEKEKLSKDIISGEKVKVEEKKEQGVRIKEEIAPLINEGCEWSKEKNPSKDRKTKRKKTTTSR